MGEFDPGNHANGGIILRVEILRHSAGRQHQRFEVRRVGVVSKRHCAITGSNASLDQFRGQQFAVTQKGVHVEIDQHFSPFHQNNPIPCGDYSMSILNSQNENATLFVTERGAPVTGLANV